MLRSAPPWVSRSRASRRSEPVAWSGCASQWRCSAWRKPAPTLPEVVQVLEGWDDEQLLAALGEAVKAREAVPEWFVETGKNAYAWHNIDSELAQLTYDSASERESDRDLV